MLDILDIITTKSTHTICALTNIAIKRRLHFKHDSMLLEWFNYPEYIDTMVLVSKKEKDVGVGVVLKDTNDLYGNIGVYVKKGHRRGGIGKIIRNKLIKHANVDIISADHDVRSYNFYKGLVASVDDKNIILL